MSMRVVTVWMHGAVEFPQRSEDARERIEVANLSEGELQPVVLSGAVCPSLAFLGLMLEKCALGFSLVTLLEHEWGRLEGRRVTELSKMRALGLI